MGSGYDEVAKAIATNVPRRKVLKMLAGGVAASIGSAVVASSAAAQPRVTTETNSASQGAVEQVPGVNGDIFEFFIEHPWWYPFYPFSNFLFGINGSFPF